MAKAPEFSDGVRLRRASTSRLAKNPETRMKLANRACQLFDDDTSDRALEQDMRVQRYAKFRGWTEPKDWPWADASNIGITDIMQHSLRVQDTLHNAVMSARPPVTSKAHNKANKDFEKSVDLLLDYQMFIEQGPSGEGERAIGELIEQYVNDGHFTAFVPWVKEHRMATERHVYPPIMESIPEAAADLEAAVGIYFTTILNERFPDHPVTPLASGWDFKIDDGDGAEAAFYTDDDDKIELVISRKVERFNGPKLMPLSWDQVLHPARAANLQIPGPSNPNGAGHFIIVDHPTLDEIEGHRRSGFYDLLTDQDISSLKSWAGSGDDNNEATGANEQVRDDMAGRGNASPGTDTSDDKADSVFTRLLVFDIYAFEDGKPAEDVVYWVLKETETVCRVRRLTEQFPSNPPRRPIAEAQFIPVEKRRTAISLVEMVEGLHDTIKMLYDQTVDGGSIRNAPMFFYKSTGATRNEVIRWSPGEGYPLSNPREDVHIPNWQQSGAAEAINLITLLGTQQERTTMQSGLAFGQVPRGGASALRTIGGMAMVNNHLEARPERILRRFFLGLSEIYRIFHTSNQQLLPEKKEILVRGPLEDGEDPYQQTVRRNNISGDFMFEFSANAFNASRVAFQQSIDEVIGMYVNPLMMQLGIIDANGIYRLARDFGDTRGIEPGRYIKPPTARAYQQDILAGEAISLILQGLRPDGYPAEEGGAQEHLEALVAFFEDPEQSQFLETEGMRERFAEWVQKVQQIVQQERLQAMAAEFGGTLGGGAQPQAAGGGGGEPPVQQNELLDEGLPSAGGGANGSAA